MRLFLFPLFLSALLQPAAAQQAPAEAPKKARIEGTVVGLSGEAVPRAQLRLTGPRSAQGGQIAPPASFAATSDDAGKFVIDNIDPGANYTLTAQRTGFVTARYGARSANSAAVTFSLEAGQVKKDLTVTMTPQGVVTGRVTDVNGDPIQNARVALLRRGYSRGVRQLLTGSTANTNDQGDFRLANLTPGRYFLMVQRSPTASLTGGTTPQVMSLDTFYPNAADERGAAPIEVTSGQEVRGIDVRLRQGRVFSIRGKLLGINGAPEAGSQILASPKSTADGPLSPAQGSSLGGGQTKPDGSFELRGLAAGFYTLTTFAVQNQNGPARYTSRVDVNVVDSDLNDVVLQIQPGFTVTGSVTLEDGDIKNLLPPVDPSISAQTLVLNAAMVNAGILVSGARPTIALTDVTPVFIGGVSPSVVKDDGTFQIDGVAPGRYQLNVAALPANTYVKSARFGGTDVTRNPIDLTTGGALEIVLSNKAADITGAVRSDKNDSMAGVTVSLWTRDPEPGTATNGVRTVTTDQAGGFQLKGLRPGVYYVAAWADIDTGLAQARDFLTLLTTEATKLELAEGAHAATEIKLIPIAKIKAAEEKLP